MKASTILILFCLLAFPAFAEVRLPEVFGDGMVLQRDAPIPLWGWANPKEKISVQFLGKVYETCADKRGEWKISLPSQKAGGPYVLEINNKEIKDVLIGDLWLCSGQSNMELPMSRVTALFADEISRINNPNIRHYKTPTRYDFRRPEADLPVGAGWKSATPDGIMGFSATAYFFASYLYDRYEVPIGLLNSSVGGSPIEAWLSLETVKNYPKLLEDVQKCMDDACVENTKRMDAENAAEWQKQLNEKDAGYSLWYEADTDVSAWDEIALPGYWGEKDVQLKAGVIWFCKEINIPASMEGKAGTLHLGCIVDADQAYINGELAGSTSYQYPPRIYPVKAGLLKAGKNTVTVRVVSNGGRGGFVVEKPYKLVVDNESIDLTGIWKYKIGAKVALPPSSTTFQNKPSGLYNGMIAPLRNIPFKGVIWYQGESNTGRVKEYAELFPEFIRDWRTAFGNPNLPFIYVQLPNFMRVQKLPVESNWAALRDVQRRTLTLPYTGMAVAIDLGEWNDIHPLNKKEVGRRLSLEAQRIVYCDTTLVSNGPLYESMKIEDGCIFLTFSPAGSGLYANLDLHGFVIAGEDRKYVWANATVVARNKIKVWSNSIGNPVSVRYAWADNPADANLMNMEGLPASPFTTE